MKSNCCGADMIDESDLCSECLEHCESVYTAEDLQNIPFEEQIEIIDGGAE